MDIFSFVKLFDTELEDSFIVKSGKHYYRANKETQEIKDTIQRDMFSVGLYLGCEGKYFEPSAALIEIISKLPGADKRKVFINEKSESLFLYGRNVLHESISRNPNNITEGLVFIQNEHDENLGYGLFQAQGKDIVIKNILDKGIYLRSEVRKKK